MLVALCLPVTDVTFVDILAHQLQALGHKAKEVKYIGFLPMKHSRTYQEMTSYRKTKKKRKSEAN